MNRHHRLLSTSTASGTEKLCGSRTADFCYRNVGPVTSLLWISRFTFVQIDDLLMSKFPFTQSSKFKVHDPVCNFFTTLMYVSVLFLYNEKRV